MRVLQSQAKSRKRPPKIKVESSSEEESSSSSSSSSDSSDDSSSDDSSATNGSDDTTTGDSSGDETEVKKVVKPKKKSPIRRSRRRRPLALFSKMPHRPNLLSSKSGKAIDLSEEDSEAKEAADAFGRSLEAMGYNLDCDSFITKDGSVADHFDERYRATQRGSETWNKNAQLPLPKTLPLPRKLPSPKLPSPQKFRGWSPFGSPNRRHFGTIENEVSTTPSPDIIEMKVIEERRDEEEDEEDWDELCGRDGYFADAEASSATTHGIEDESMNQTLFTNTSAKLLDHTIHHTTSLVTNTSEKLLGEQYFQPERGGRSSSRERRLVDDARRRRTTPTMMKLAKLQEELIDCDIDPEEVKQMLAEVKAKIIKKNKLARRNRNQPARISTRSSPDDEIDVKGSGPQLATPQEENQAGFLIPSVTGAISNLFGHVSELPVCADEQGKIEEGLSSPNGFSSKFQQHPEKSPFKRTTQLLTNDEKRIPEFIRALAKLGNGPNKNQGKKSPDDGAVIIEGMSVMDEQEAVSLVPNRQHEEEVELDKRLAERILEPNTDSELEKKKSKGKQWLQVPKRLRRQAPTIKEPTRTTDARVPNLSKNSSIEKEQHLGQKILKSSVFNDSGLDKRDGQDVDITQSSGRQSSGPTPSALNSNSVQIVEAKPLNAEDKKEKVLPTRNEPGAFNMPTPIQETLLTKTLNAPGKANPEDTKKAENQSKISGRYDKCSSGVRPSAGIPRLPIGAHPLQTAGKKNVIKQLRFASSKETEVNVEGYSENGSDTKEVPAPRGFWRFAKDKRSHGKAPLSNKNVDSSERLVPTPLESDGQIEENKAPLDLPRAINSVSSSAEKQAPALTFDVNEHPSGGEKTDALSKGGESLSTIDASHEGATIVTEIPEVELRIATEDEGPANHGNNVLGSALKHSPARISAGIPLFRRKVKTTLHPIDDVHVSVGHSNKSKAKKQKPESNGPTAETYGDENKPEHSSSLSLKEKAGMPSANNTPLIRDCHVLENKRQLAFTNTIQTERHCGSLDHVLPTAHPPVPQPSRQQTLAKTLSDFMEVLMSNKNGVNHVQTKPDSEATREQFDAQSDKKKYPFELTRRPAGSLQRSIRVVGIANNNYDGLLVGKGETHKSLPQLETSSSDGSLSNNSLEVTLIKPLPPPSQRGQKMRSLFSSPKRRATVEKTPRSIYPIEFNDDNYTMNEPKPVSESLQEGGHVVHLISNQVGETNQASKMPGADPITRVPTLSTLAGIVETIANESGRVEATLVTADESTNGNTWADLANAANVVEKAIERIERGGEPLSPVDHLSAMTDEHVTNQDVERALFTLNHMAKKLGVRENELLMALKSYDMESVNEEASVHTYTLGDAITDFFGMFSSRK